MNSKNETIRLLVQHGSCKHTVKRSRRCQASTEQNTKPEDEVDLEVSFPFCSSYSLQTWPLRTPDRVHASLLQNPDSEMAQKQAEQDRLRKAEKFMKIGTGTAECTACGYAYDPKKGDSEYPVSPGTKFEVCTPCSLCITRAALHPKRSEAICLLR